jgi:Domain of unknown function (DUF4262)
MCWKCDHPNASYADYLAELEAMIDCHGWAVQGVERNRIQPPWAYTVGLTALRRPELVITGMPLRRAADVLNGVAAHLAHAKAPSPGTQAGLIDGPFVEFVRVTQPSAHLNMAVVIYGKDIRALQLVHADDRGHWPWDERYRGVRGGQPVLGVREPAERRKRVG